MKARRQIVDPLTGAKVSPDSPIAVDTGQRIVGRGTVVDDDELDPSRDRFGIDPDAVANIRARERADRKRQEEKAPKGRGPAFPTSMASPEAGTKQFVSLNPEVIEAAENGDVRDITRDFMDGIEVRSGKGHKKLAATSTGEKILGTGKSWDGGRIATAMFKFLIGQAQSRRWRDVPWGSVINYAQAIAPDAPVTVPVAAGIQSPEETLARVREEYGPAAAAKLERKMNADELTSLADRLEAAIEDKGEECLSSTATSAAKQRLAMLRRWARKPETVPQWSCVGSRESEGGYCTFPAILEDIRRIEGSCERDYDPRWPIKRAEKACDDGDDAEPSGIVGEPCAIARQARRDATPEPRYVLALGRMVRI